MHKAAPVFGQVKRKAWDSKQASKRTILGRSLQSERRRLFEAEPLCRECAKQGRVTVATIRDHVIALAFGGKDERGNTQPLCKPCHDKKSNEESKLGRGLSKL